MAPSLAACTSAPTALDKAVACLEAKGIAVTVDDGVIVATQYANDDATPVSREELNDCMPAELRE